MKIFLDAEDVDDAVRMILEKPETSPVSRTTWTSTMDFIETLKEADVQDGTFHGRWSLDAPFAEPPQELADLEQECITWTACHPQRTTSSTSSAWTLWWTRSGAMLWCREREATGFLQQKQDTWWSPFWLGHHVRRGPLRVAKLLLTAHATDCPGLYAVPNNFGDSSA